MRITTTLVLFLITTTLSAQEIPELVTDRPDLTESSRVVPHGALQVEGGMVFESSADDLIRSFPKVQTLSVPSVLIRYGVLDYLELRGLGEYSHTFTSYNSDVLGRRLDSSDGGVMWGVGAKLQLMQESGLLPETALIGHMIFPHPFESLEPELILTASHTLSPTLGLGYNIGAVFNTDAGHIEPLYSLTMATDVVEPMGAYVEVFGGWDSNNQPSHSFDGGVTYLLNPNLQFDLSAGFGLSQLSPQYYVSAGASWRLLSDVVTEEEDKGWWLENE